LRVARKRDAPGLALARDGDVLEAALEQAQHLVAPDLGLDAQGARADALEHRVAVGAQAKKVVALPGGDERERGVLDAAAVGDLRLGLELLAPGAVQPLVLRFVQVAGPARADALEESGDRAGVPRLRGADPVVGA